MAFGVWIPSYLLDNHRETDAMADQPIVHIGENSPEQVAFKLMHEVLFNIENTKWENLDRKTYLDTYSECLLAVTYPNRRLS